MGKTEKAEIVARPTLKLLRAAGQINQIPGVAPLAELALGILDAARAAKNNKNDFREIANQCCVLTAALTERALCIKGGQVPPMLIQDAQTLFGVLKDISTRISKHAKRSWWKRFFTAAVDTDIITGCRHQLANAAQLFSIQADLELRTQIPEMYQLLLDVVKKVNVQAPASQQEHQRPQAQLPNNSSYQVTGPNHGNVGPNNGVIGTNNGNIGSNSGVVGVNYGNVGPNNGYITVQSPPQSPYLSQLASVPPAPAVLPNLGPQIFDPPQARAERLRQRADRQRQNAQYLRQQAVWG